MAQTVFPDYVCTVGFYSGTVATYNIQVAERRELVAKLLTVEPPVEHATAPARYRGGMMLYSDAGEGPPPRRECLRVADSAYSVTSGRFPFVIQVAAV